MLLLSISLGTLLAGILVYHFIKVKQLKEEVINYKVKYESTKTYAEELIKNSAKAEKKAKAPTTKEKKVKTKK